MPRCVGVGDLVGGDQGRADRGEGVEGLAHHPLLARLVELPVACRDVVADGVAGDVLHRPIAGDVPPPLADDDHQLGLVIDLGAHLGQDDLGPRADQGRCVFAEDDRLGGDRHAALGGVVAIVQAQADDLGRVGDRRQQGRARRVVADVAPRQGPPRRGAAPRRPAPGVPGRSPAARGRPPPPPHTAPARPHTPSGPSPSEPSPSALRDLPRPVA